MLLKFAIVAGYLLVGFFVAILMLAISGTLKFAKGWHIGYLSLLWPFLVIAFTMGVLSKLIQKVTSKIWFMILWVAFLILLLIHAIPTNAATITGDTPLAGASWVYAHKTEMWYDPEDLELLAQVLEHENYCNGKRAMYLTGAVVINRRNSSKWPNTVRDVIYQKGQYSTTDKFWTRPVHRDCYRIASWLLIFGCPDVPSNVVYQAMFKQGSGVYEKVNTDYFCYE